MSRLAEILDKKVREKARADYPLAELERTASEGFLGDRALLETTRQILDQWDKNKISGNKAIKLIRQALKANGRCRQKMRR